MWKWNWWERDLAVLADEEAATKLELELKEWEAKDYFLLSVSKIMITLVCFLQVNEAEIPTN